MEIKYIIQTEEITLHFPMGAFVKIPNSVCTKPFSVTNNAAKFHWITCMNQVTNRIIAETRYFFFTKASFYRKYTSVFFPHKNVNLYIGI